MTDYPREKELENTVEHWERRASNPAAPDLYTLGPRPSGDRFMDPQAPLLKGLVSGMILDAGAGYGRFTVPMAEMCELVVAVDLSPSMIGRLRLNAREHRVESKIEIVKADMRYLPFRDGCFDGIVCWATFYCLPKRYWNSIMLDFTKALKTDGWLLVTLKTVTTALRPRYGFGLLYLMAYLVLRLESKFALLRSLSQRFGLHGRTEYLITKKGARMLLSTFFSQVASEGGSYMIYTCRFPTREASEGLLVSSIIPQGDCDDAHGQE